MGIVIIRKRGTEKLMSAKELGAKIARESKYYGSYRGTLVEGGAEVRYNRVGRNFVAEVGPLSW